jgi:excisionase family DNA binding protein
MNQELPLAAAQRRLGRPGRPRKQPPEGGHDAGITSSRSRMNGGPKSRTLASHASAPLPPRLLDLSAAAAYLNLSTWTLRDLVGNRTLRRVRVPLPNGGELRRVLFDREDLDELIQRWKT